MNIHRTTKSIPVLTELTIYHLHGLNAVFLVVIIEIDNRQHAKLGSWILFSKCKDNDPFFWYCCLPNSTLLPILPLPLPLPPPLPYPSLPFPRTKKEHCTPFMYRVQTNLGNYLQDCVPLNLKLSSVLPSLGLLSSVLPLLGLLAQAQANTDSDMRIWFLWWISMKWNNMKSLLKIMVSMTIFRNCIFFLLLLTIICL